MIFFLIIGIVLIVFGFYMSWYTKFYALEKIGQNIKIAKKKELNDTSIEGDKDENVKVNKIRVTKGQLLVMRIGPLVICLGLTSVILYFILK